VRCMKNRGMGIKHPKIRGEWVELRFMMRAIELGLHLNKPWGEVMPYDFAVEHEAQFVRVQVKSTMFIDRGGYSCTVRGTGGAGGGTREHCAVSEAEGSEVRCL
jgi:PD-(D/E)XK endonuclease